MAAWRTTLAAHPGVIGSAVVRRYCVRRSNIGGPRERLGEQATYSTIERPDPAVQADVEQRGGIALLAA
jgi:hypothetical protein